MCSNSSISSSLLKLHLLPAYLWRQLFLTKLYFQSLTFLINAFCWGPSLRSSALLLLLASLSRRTRSVEKALAKGKKSAVATDGRITVAPVTTVIPKAVLLLMLRHYAVALVIQKAPGLVNEAEHAELEQKRCLVEGRLWLFRGGEGHDNIDLQSIHGPITGVR